MPGKQGRSNNTVAHLAAENKALGRELWLMALNDGKGEYNNRREPRVPPSKKSFSNLSPTSPRAEDRPFLSTPHYLRNEMAGIPAPSPGTPTRQPLAAGTKRYKQPEEYHDEVMLLKKRVSDLKGENELLKSKNRRLEDENNKKEKMLENLLDPAKNEGAFSARKPSADTSLAVQSLKQKIFKLEKQLKEKDTQYQELSSQIKYTRQEEMKTQLEVLYTEVLRLRSASDAELRYAAEEGEKGHKAATEENGTKQEALMKAIKRLNEDKEQLVAENQHLREELDVLVGPSDRNKLGSSSTLYQKDTDQRPRSSKVDTENKIALDGNLRERLDALDKRETELLDEIKHLNKRIARLQEDRDSFKKKYDDKCAEVKELNAALSRYKKGGGKGDIPSTQLPPRGRPTPADRRHSSRSSPSAAEIENFRRNHAARVIQREWKKYHEEENNNLFIQSALRGYLRRDKFLRGNDDDRRSSSSSSDGSHRHARRGSDRHDRRDDRHDGKEFSDRHSSNRDDRKGDDHRHDKAKRDRVSDYDRSRDRNSPDGRTSDRRLDSSFRKSDRNSPGKSKSTRHDSDEQDSFFRDRGDKMGSGSRDSPSPKSPSATKRSSSRKSSMREGFAY